MYSTHNKGKSVAAERLIRCRQYPKNVYIDKLTDIVNE